jgi:hypothetical protein
MNTCHITFITVIFLVLLLLLLLIIIIINGSMALSLGLRPIFNFFLIPLTDSNTPWMGHQPTTRPLSIQENTNSINAHRHSMFRVEFKLLTPENEWTKTVHALVNAATVISIKVVQQARI